MTQPAHSIDLRPHPRVLSVLGDIPFAPWQCIAELLDNCFDEFLRHPGEGGRPRVSITLPGRNSHPTEAEVWITDNGPGLTLDQLQNALRAGWTSNDRHGHLGLFGMGFNIATARMGNITRVRTARAEDPHWTVVTLNLPEMQRAGHFDVPVRTEPKSHPGEHGTEIVVSDLKPALHDQLSRNSRKLRETLGDVYSYLLTQHDFELTVDATAVQPRRPCIWAPERFVVRNGERIPAYVEIDEPLGERLACLDCGTWQDDLGVAECRNCKSQRLQRRERRIWGWLGIQRYTDKKDYGIDFLRNGRKILLRDKSMFDWVDPDDPIASGEREYPVEVPYEGRIVGEIHVDHLWVPYQKNGFETAAPDWVKVRRTLRGESPLRPQKARKLGYTANLSPLAQLFTGYRRTNGGLKNLMPGDGRTALLTRAREWAELFQKGDPDYQTDERWYEQAELHDRPTPSLISSPPPSLAGMPFRAPAWATIATSTPPPATPLALRPSGTLRPLEQMLGLLIGAGFPPVRALHIYRAYWGVLFGHVLDELQEVLVDPDATDALLQLGLHRLPERGVPPPLARRRAPARLRRRRGTRREPGPARRWPAGGATAAAKGQASPRGAGPVSASGAIGRRSPVSSNTRQLGQEELHPETLQGRLLRLTCRVASQVR